jgi:hypothetical protein
VALHADEDARAGVHCVPLVGCRGVERARSLASSLSKIVASFRGFATRQQRDSLFMSAASSTPREAASVAEMPLQLREAQIVPASFNEADNTVDVVWTTGARRRAYDWYNDTVYEEELVVDADAVDMTRFDNGVVQVLDNHQVYGGTGSILGIAIRGAITKGQRGRRPSSCRPTPRRRVSWATSRPASSAPFHSATPSSATKSRARRTAPMA